MTDLSRTTSKMRNGSPPIIVVGLARSGTSWLGKVLSFIDGYTYYREPDNVNYVRGTRNYFEQLYLAGEMNDLDYAKHMDRATSGRVANHFTMSADPGPWLDKLPPQFRRLGNVVPGLYRRQSGVLLKLVYANLTLDWLARRYPDARIIYIRRHPAAVFASWKRLGWTPHLEPLLNQPALMADHLEPYRDTLERVDSFWAKAGALWGAIHRVIENQSAAGLPVRVVSFEDLCESPEAGFHALYEYLGCAWNTQVDEFVRASHTRGDRKQAYSLSRNSKDMIATWQKEVEPAEWAICSEVIDSFRLAQATEQLDVYQAT
ncbi:MAG: sulfotransferase [Planctomycetota bacterium]